MDLVEPHQNRNQIREKIFPFIIELTVTLPQCSVQGREAEVGLETVTPSGGTESDIGD